MNTDTQSPPDIYIPPGAKRIADLGDSQIRLGIQGPPFSGKTTASLTFPNPIVVSFDRKVSAHKDREDVIVIPFHDAGFIKSICPSTKPGEPLNRKEALVTWMQRQAVQLRPTQTLIIDGITAIEEEYHIWFRFRENQLALTKQGDIDGRVEWRMKKDYFEELHSLAKTTPANVIWICHEQPERNDKGELTGKYTVLLTGQSGDKLGGNLTDFVRQHAIGKPTSPDMVKRFKEKFGCSDQTFAEWMASGTQETLFLWQTQQDESFKGGASSMRSIPKWILPTYESFQRYCKPQPNKH